MSTSVAGTRASVLALILAHAAIASAEPGRLISTTPIAGAPPGSAAWRIRYDTTTRDGRTVQSTGVLVAPSGAASDGKRNVVAWAHGTTGVAEKCAPSLGAHALTSIPALAHMLSQGWVVVATDYPGLGTPGPHAYLVGLDAAYAVLDSVRAAQHLARAHAGSRFIVWGLSQGAHAALFTGQESQRYAPDLQLAGVVAAAPPTDLARNLGGGANPTVRAILTAFAAASWSRVYQADLATIATPMTQRVLRRLASTCGSEDPGLRTKVEVLRLRRQLAHVDMTTIDPWRDLLEANSAGRSAAGAPLFVAQGSADAVVAPDVTERFVADACGRGERVRFVRIPNGIHRETALNSATDAVVWMADRFRGQSAPSDCPVR